MIVRIFWIGLIGKIDKRKKQLMDVAMKGFLLFFNCER